MCQFEVMSFIILLYYCIGSLAYLIVESRSLSNTFGIRVCAASAENLVSASDGIKTFTCGILAVWTLTAASPVIAANQVSQRLAYAAFTFAGIESF